MAFLYKFSRKSKKDQTENNPTSAQDNFFPLLFSEENDSPSPESAVNEESVPSSDTTDFPAVKEISAASKGGEEKASPENDTDTDEALDCESTRSFTLSEPKKAETDPESLADTKVSRTLPEELFRALGETTVDDKKMDEVFRKARGSLSAETSREEYEKTTALLKEVFGTDNADKKKKKAETVTDAGEIQEVFHKAKTLQEALQEAKLKGEEGEDDYVAVHDSQDESTKEYHTSFSFEKELSELQSEESHDAVPPMAEEVQVPEQDNPYSDTYDELEEKRQIHAVLPEEFTSYEEYDEFAEHLRNRNFKGVIAGAWSLLAFLVLLYLESATFSTLYHPEFLKPGGIYNMIYLLVDIQLVLISSLLVLSSLGEGVKGIFCGKPNRHSFTALISLVAVLHPVSMLILGEVEYPLFGAVAALFHLFTALSNSLESKRIYRTFRIFGKRGEKLVARKLTDEGPEAEAFRDQLEGEPTFYSVQKSNFIEGFFRGVNTDSQKGKAFGISLILSFVASLAFAGFSYFKTPDLALAITHFSTMLVMTLPLSGIMTVVFPFSHLSKKAEKKDCAILNTTVAAEHAACDVVSFTDHEIFPPKSVKITTIRTYGQTRIDKAILYGAMIFQKLGGPLSLVFKKTISGVMTDIPENFDFLEITSDGMCAKIDGKSIFVGNKNYLLSYDFGYTKDEMDESFEEKSGKIMYMVIGAELAAKFYIRYSISKRFQKTIVTLFKSGICPAVKTCDPNIDSDLFRTLLENDKIPAGIIKTSDAMKDAPAMEACEGGLVCTSSIANLLHGFTLCDSLCHLIRANVVTRILSLLLGAGIVIFLFFIENLTKITGLFAILYHILWMIPVIIPSLSE